MAIINSHEHALRKLGNKSLKFACFPCTLSMHTAEWAGNSCYQSMEHLLTKTLDNLPSAMLCPVPYHQILQLLGLNKPCSISVERLLEILHCLNYPV